MVGVGVAKRTIRGGVVGLAYSSHVARPFWHVWHGRSVGCVEAVLWRVFWVSALQGQRGGISASPSLRARVAEGAFFRSTRVCGGGSFFAQAAAPREGAVIKDLRLSVCISMR